MQHDSHEIVNVAAGGEYPDDHPDMVHVVRMARIRRKLYLRNATAANGIAMQEADERVEAHRLALADGTYDA